VHCQVSKRLQVCDMKKLHTRGSGFRIGIPDWFVIGIQIYIKKLQFYIKKLQFKLLYML